MRVDRIAFVAVVVGVAAGASMAMRPAAAPDLKPEVLRYWALWQRGPDAAAPLYAKDADLVFYDLEPLKYVGWDSYKAGVGPNILAKFATVTFTVNDDVKTSGAADFAWTTATVKGDGTLKGGAPVHIVMRHTAIWQKRGREWLIVHEHVSVPSSLPAQ
ncbi:MAG: YybH family protein [Vicinamibacterales bacterium]